MSLTSAETGYLPLYALAARSRELRQRGVLLCWRAQRLRSKSPRLLAKALCSPVVRLVTEGRDAHSGRCVVRAG